MNLFQKILKTRGLEGPDAESFLNPDYLTMHDPFLLPDMDRVVQRLVEAHQKQQRITIYGDYDIDGLTATSVLLDALNQFGFKDVKAFIPNRFTEGYGLTIDAIERIAADGAELVVTVDCGSLSHKEIERANQLGVDVIVTDHHNVAPEQPPAVGVINPKRLLQDYPDEYEKYQLKPNSNMQGVIYPFLDLAGVGVAFKLVQALQTKLDGLPLGQEKWLLDLVALGTVCDIVTLVDENRVIVFWGLKVLSKTRRKGLRALMAVSNVAPEAVTARSLGFGLGPRMNASGRLETAQYALDMLIADDPMEALRLARQLDDMNQKRRKDQDIIFEEAIAQAEEMLDDPVLVVSAVSWNHGIVGIVAAKLLERYKKPTYVLSEGEEGEAKGSARSYGDFSAADAIRASDDIITKGGGHKLAAGVTLPVVNIPAFRKRVNDFYKDAKLKNQADLLLPKSDVDARLSELSESLVADISKLEPFGSGNSQPILRSSQVKVSNLRRMGQDAQHVKLTVTEDGSSIEMLAFGAPEHFFQEPGTIVSVWYQVDINEWNGRRSVEGRLLHLEVSE